MKHYLLMETELENVSFINGSATAGFSLGSFLVSWPIGRLIEYANSSLPNPPPPELLYWILLIVSVGFFGFGLFALRKHGSIYSIIRSETTHKHADSNPPA